ncbi:MAG: acyl-CoA thioesterase [Flammeovirgaceae bacterium]|nr:acyl-CoA thioesterase [Flammeovirgaceae bacterium]
MELVKELIKKPESKSIIRFQDCDPYGHLNNARYLDYFVNAREDHLLKYYDLDLFKMSKEQGIGFVVRQNQISYFRPANLMEEVVIQSALIAFNESTVKIEMQMFNKNKSEFKAVLWADYVAMDLRSGKRTVFPDDMYNLLEMVKIEDANGSSDSFESRVYQIAKALKKG